MEIREAQSGDEAGIARVRVDSWRSTYPGIMPDAVLNSLSYADREARWQQAIEGEATDVVVADAPDRGIVGFAAGGPERSRDARYDGELYAIYLLDEVQGQGIGRRLTVALADRLLQRGFASMLVWVAVGVPACRFYEALGGRALEERAEQIDDATLQVIGYGWDDIRPLTSGEDSPQGGAASGDRAS